MKFLNSPSPDVVIDLLSQAGLPTSDITPELLTRFIGATSTESILGVIGYEAFDNLGLLRSLVVAPHARGQRLGDKLVEKLERNAKEAGIENLYLLTTDADPFFARLGYKPVERSAVPDSIRNTTQFSSLCPGSATVMLKPLVD